MKNESNYSVLLHFFNAYKTIFSKYRTYRILHYVIIIDGTAIIIEKYKDEIVPSFKCLYYEKHLQHYSNTVDII